VELLAPSPPTLAKYGLSLADWQAIADRQNHLWAICKNLPTSGRLVIDHEHVKGWAKMPPDQRRRYVRGLVCFHASHAWLGKGMSIERALAMTAYLGAYQ
jgi:hypothetical protein